jgi:Holliday junction resolvase RusA-like endonuclease
MSTAAATRRAHAGGELVRFTVHGVAQPAGSKRAFYNAKRGRPIVTEDNRRSKPWMALVQNAALEAMTVHGDEGTSGYAPPLEGPLALTLTIYLPRPVGHYGSGRNAERLRPSAPAYPTTRPDATKLLRAIEDSCTGVIWRDDAQVVDQRLRKFYGDPPRIELACWQLAPHS